MAVGAGVVDHQQIADLHLRQHPVHRELVAVLAQRTSDVVLVVTGLVLLAHDRNVVVGPVNGRAHQVGGAGIHAHIVLVDVLHVQHPGHQVAVGSQHEAAQLGADGHVVHARGHQDLLVSLAHALADDGDIVGGLLGTVGHAHAAGEVDEGDVAAGLRLQIGGQLEQDAGQGGIVVVGQGVGGQEGVDAELLGAHLLQAGEGLSDLLPGHAVLGVAGVVHHLEALLALAQLEHTAGIEAAGDLLGNVADGVFQKVHVADVVQVDGGAQLGGQDEFLGGGVVGGEHDLSPLETTPVGHHQLAQGGAVHTAALFLENLQDLGVGGGLHGKVLGVAGVPGKGPAQGPGVLPDALLVIQVEGSGILLGDLLQLLQGDKRLFHVHRSFLYGLARHSRTGCMLILV